MTYRILRNETRKDSNDNDEIFLQVEVDDGTEVYTRAEWLTHSDVALVISDGSNIDTIASQVADRAVKGRPAIKSQEAHDKEVQLAQIALDTVNAQLELAKLQQ